MATPDQQPGGEPKARFNEFARERDMRMVCIFSGGAIGGDVAGATDGTTRSEIGLAANGQALCSVRADQIGSATPKKYFFRIHAFSDARGLGVHNDMSFAFKSIFRLICAGSL